jgi:hypothetical protein
MPRATPPRGVSRVVKPQRYAVIGCSTLCSFSADKLGDNFLTVHGWFEEGVSVRGIVIKAEDELGISVSQTSAFRHHKRHLRAVFDGETPSEVDVRTKRTASDLDVLEGIISAGWRNSGNWKPTIQDTLKAMDMKLRLTKGSVFEDFFTDIDAALLEDEAPAVPAAPENPEAVAEAPESVEG